MGTQFSFLGEKYGGGGSDCEISNIATKLDFYAHFGIGEKGERSIYGHRCRFSQA